MALTVEETSLIKRNVFFHSEVSLSQPSSGFVSGNVCSWFRVLSFVSKCSVHLLCHLGKSFSN